MRGKSSAGEFCPLVMKSWEFWTLDRRHAVGHGCGVDVASSMWGVGASTQPRLLLAMQVRDKEKGENKEICFFFWKFVACGYYFRQQMQQTCYEMP